MTHSAQHACPKCIFITSTEEELRAHVQEMHGVDDFMDILSDDEVKTPKTNAQGRVICLDFYIHLVSLYFVNT